jgi:hypothetical protein
LLRVFYDIKGEGELVGKGRKHVDDEIALKEVGGGDLLQ